MDKNLNPQKSFAGLSKDNKINTNSGSSITNVLSALQNEANDFVKCISESREKQGNEFPIEVFPPLFRDLITGCKDALNFPVDYTGTAILSAVSTAIGKSRKMKVKNQWHEYASLFIAVVGNSGVAKSHPIALVFKPLEKIEGERVKRFAKDYKEYEDYLALSQKDKKDNKDIGQSVKPILVKTIIIDFSHEVLCQRLADNDRGCIVISDELATVLIGMNAYSKGDRTSTYLTFWSNKSTSVDRIGKPIPLWIPEPYLNMIGGLQPRMVTKLFPADKTDNGFLQRILFAFPDNVQKESINDHELDEAVFEKYSQWIEQCQLDNPVYINPETESPEPRILNWGLDAKAFFYEWQRDNSIEVNESAEMLKGEMLSKFDIHFVRLCIILQVMQDYKSNEISLKAARGAEKLCTYFKHNAMKILNLLDDTDELDKLPLDKKSLYNALPINFKTGAANALGLQFEMNTKAVQRFLSADRLFDRVKTGHYSKKVKSQVS